MPFDTAALTQRIGPLPLWVWGIAGIGGSYLVFRYMKNRNGPSGGLGNSTTTPDPNIDQNTGIPYSIESAINPHTGLPAYYGGPGIDTGVFAGAGGSGGPTGEPGSGGPTIIKSDPSTIIPRNVQYSATGVPVSSNGFPIGPPPPHVVSGPAPIPVVRYPVQTAITHPAAVASSRFSAPPPAFRGGFRAY